MELAEFTTPKLQRTALPRSQYIKSNNYSYISPFTSNPTNMRGILKTVLIIFVFLLSGFLITISKEAAGRGNSSGSGPFGFIIMAASGAAIVAIWRYKPKSDANATVNSDIQKLDKN